MDRKDDFIKLVQQRQRERQGWTEGRDWMRKLLNLPGHRLIKVDPRLAEDAAVVYRELRERDHADLRSGSE